MGTCYIIGAGEVGILDFVPDKEDMVIACDGGYRHGKKWGIRMDLVVILILWDICRIISM